MAVRFGGKARMWREREVKVGGDLVIGGHWGRRGSKRGWCVYETPNLDGSE